MSSSPSPAAKKSRSKPKSRSAGPAPGAAHEPTTPAGERPSGGRTFWPQTAAGRKIFPAVLAAAFLLRIYHILEMFPILVDESIYLRWAEIIDHQGQWFISLLDGKGGTLRDTVVVVSGDKIERIGGPVPRGAQVYDLGGLTVAPGLIDTHVHVSYHFSHDRFIDNRLVGQDEPVPDSVLFGVENGVRILEAGFTTVQSLGPGTAWDLPLREAWRATLCRGRDC